MAAEKSEFTGAVLAGGQSTRMGTDKALLDLDGRALIEVSSGALAAAGAAEIFAIGGNGPEIEALGIRWIADEFPGEGPLGAIVTALRAAVHPVVVVLACDHTATEGPAVHAVVGALGDGDVVVPVVEGRAQTLHAAWRRSCLPAVEEIFHRGARSVSAALDQLDVVELLDGDPCWFADADTPADLDQPRPPTRQ